ncbi:MAG TPA: hypothetical protein VFE51_00730 [Verrucomicrobiae bacterium]|nr:hypothetical protein [Verrucomicrobiae bacterium]
MQPLLNSAIHSAQRNNVPINFSSPFAGGWLAVLALAFACHSGVFAQSDNFDSYSSTSDLQKAGWILSSLNPALVNTTLPPDASGKGLRIQANPVPGQAPAVGMWYRTNEYDDFYVAVDIASWPGTDKNQAAVMFARMTDASTGTVVPDQNPGAAQGVICNYDTSQYGENPGDRRQGQFQINLVNPGFNATTLADAEITLVPGRPYRLVFRGVGFHYTGMVYDWNDLTAPLVTIEADDSTLSFSSGACGILAYSRQGTSGTADITFDNYYAGTNDPNPAAAPILAHPVAGTPAVDTRVPTARWKNFLSPLTSLSFTANTYSTNVIKASATQVRLNGRDLSAQLNLSADGTNISGSLPATVLASNTLYSAEIVVSDLAGTKTSTNTFWFDTFSDAFLLSSGVKVIEAEEYNYNAGDFQLDPIPVSGTSTNGIAVNGNGIGYFGEVGGAGIDFSNHNANPDPNFSAFRSGDAVRTLNGGLIGIQDGNHLTEYDPASDNVRSQHARSNLLEYVVTRTEPGEWLNYTRSFSAGLYSAFLRYSSFGATSNELDLVTSDPTQPDQTATKLGVFRIGNNIRWSNYLYTPLVDDSGAPVLLSLAGTNTLRLQIAGTPGEDNRKTMLNYIMLVQSPVQVWGASSPIGPFALEPSAVVDAATRTITLSASGSARFYRLSSGISLSTRLVSYSGGTVTLGF